MSVEAAWSFVLAGKTFANLVGELSQKRRAVFPELVGLMAEAAEVKPPS
ncbi:hypothetical protein [Tardiphaga alba]|nr:hypothetical protein [Tardiphaga alba]